MENEMLLKVAKTLVDNSFENDIEMVDVKHTEYPDGSKGFVVEVKYPSVSKDAEEVAYFR